jgi:16S rRNA (cytosine967-C5)-methyltransferase
MPSPRKTAPQNNGKSNKSPRNKALEILTRVEKDKGYSNLLIDSQLESGDIKGRDAAFLTTLVYGVLENMICLDFFISSFANRRAKDINPIVLNILRLGAYQLIFLDRVPASAAVAESVELAKGRGETHASGFVNAVLRQIARSLDNLPYPDKQKDLKRYLHVRYSCPQWLLSKWISEYGEQSTQGILSGIEHKPRAVLRVNTLKTTPAELASRLADEGINANAIDFPPDALEVDKLPDLRRSAAFCEGLFTVQNTASQICCVAAEAAAGDTVIDMCAAPGGKSFTLAFNMKNVGKITSLELYENRMQLITEGAKRLSIDIIKAKRNDASVHNEGLGLADIVLCDVPCSGLGVIGRKPEIRYKDPAGFDDLPDLQYAILCEGASHVKKGGTLVYSTCTLSRAENDDVVSRFLENHGEFSSALPQNIKSLAGSGAQCTVGATLFPHITRSDGFFIAVFKKI